MKKAILLYMLLSLGASAWSQTAINYVEKIDKFRKKNPDAFLYLHYDKGIYTNNEKVWFAAYLLNTPNAVEEHTVLNVALINEQTKRIEASQKFSISNGLSSGYVLLPDTVPSGNYQLMAFTNSLNAQQQPIAIFSATIKVLNIQQDGFHSKLKVADSAPKDGKTQAEVPSESPEQALPAAAQPVLEVKFYPEGGALATGLPSRVGWEAKSTGGNPVQLRGTLLKNDNPIAEVSTNAHGMGSFILKPEQHDFYSVRLYPGPYSSENVLFKLPDHAGSTDVTINLPKAIVNDSLHFTLSANISKPILILIHNDLGNYVLLKSQTDSSVKQFKLSLATLPKGLTTVTIIDEFVKPMAERLFFAHYDQKDLTARIHLEKTTFNKTDSVRIKLNLYDSAEKPVEGIVSISVVQANRVKVGTPDIENYFYLNNHLNDLPINASGNRLLDREYLEDILLIKGWRRYTQDVLMAKNSDTVINSESLILEGSVLNGKKTLKKAIDVVSMGGIKSSIITTKKDGKFSLGLADLLVENNKNIFLLANQSNYKIKINDPFDSITKTLVKGMKPSALKSMISPEESSTIKGLQNVVALKEVQITANTGTIRGTSGEKGANECGDYVDNNDQYGILNYPGTPVKDRLKPIPGRYYMKRTDLQGSYFKVEQVWYSGCLTDSERKATAIKGINSGKEYYMTTTDDSDSDYRSTYYWRSGVHVDTTGQFAFAFKTGEVAGKFLIIIQGISKNGLVNIQETIDLK